MLGLLYRDFASTIIPQQTRIQSCSRCPLASRDRPSPPGPVGARPSGWTKNLRSPTTGWVRGAFPAVSPSDGLPSFISLSPPSLFRLPPLRSLRRLQAAMRPTSISPTSLGTVNRPRRCDHRRFTRRPIVQQEISRDIIEARPIFETFHRQDSGHRRFEVCLVSPHCQDAFCRPLLGFIDLSYGHGILSIVLVGASPVQLRIS